jgi:hypothetical protein
VTGGRQCRRAAVHCFLSVQGFRAVDNQTPAPRAQCDQYWEAVRGRDCARGGGAAEGGSRGSACGPTCAQTTAANGWGCSEGTGGDACGPTCAQTTAANGWGCSEGTGRAAGQYLLTANPAQMGRTPLKGFTKKDVRTMSLPGPNIAHANDFSAPAERSEAGAKFDPRPQNPRRDEEKGDEWGQIMGNGGQMLHHCVCGGP